MDELALARLPELARGRDFIVHRHGDLVIRVPRTPRARHKLTAERALREILAPRFSPLVAAIVPCELPPPLYAYRFTPGESITAPPSEGVVAALASFVARLHAASNLPIVVDPTPREVVRRLQAIVLERFVPRLAPEMAGPVVAAARANVSFDDGLAPCPQHGDLAARNILVDDGRLVAILDWSDCVLSDPAIDFGAIVQWGGPTVLDELLARTGRARDRALRERAQIVGVLLAAIDRVHAHDLYTESR